MSGPQFSHSDYVNITHTRLHGGWLLHKPTLGNEWHEVWTVLRDNILFFFSSQNTSRETHIGTLHLTREARVLIREGGAKRGFRFDLHTANNKKNKFKTRTLYEREAWRVYLEGIITGSVPDSVVLNPRELQEIKDKIYRARNLPAPPPSALTSGPVHRHPQDPSSSGRFPALMRRPSVFSSDSGGSADVGGLDPPMDNVSQVSRSSSGSGESRRLDPGGPFMTHKFYRPGEAGYGTGHPPWFFENCSRELACRILSECPSAGNTLMRESLTARPNGSYAISKRMERSGEVTHYEVVRVAEGYRISVENPHPTMKTLSEVMDFFIQLSGPTTTFPLKTNNLKELGVEYAAYTKRIQTTSRDPTSGEEDDLSYEVPVTEAPRIPPAPVPPPLDSSTGGPSVTHSTANRGATWSSRKSYEVPVTEAPRIPPAPVPPPLDSSTGDPSVTHSRATWSSRKSYEVPVTEAPRIPPAPVPPPLDSSAGGPSVIHSAANRGATWSSKKLPVPEGMRGTQTLGLGGSRHSNQHSGENMAELRQQMDEQNVMRDLDTVLDTADKTPGKPPAGVPPPLPKGRSLQPKLDPSGQLMYVNQPDAPGLQRSQSEREPIHPRWNKRAMSLPQPSLDMEVPHSVSAPAMVFHGKPAKQGPAVAAKPKNHQVSTSSDDSEGSAAHAIPVPTSKGALSAPHPRRLSLPNVCMWRRLRQRLSSRRGSVPLPLPPDYSSVSEESSSSSSDESDSDTDDSRKDTDVHYSAVTYCTIDIQENNSNSGLNQSSPKAPSVLSSGGRFGTELMKKSKSVSSVTSVDDGDIYYIDPFCPEPPSTPLTGGRSGTALVKNSNLSSSTNSLPKVEENEVYYTEVLGEDEVVYDLMYVSGTGGIQPWQNSPGSTKRHTGTMATVHSPVTGVGRKNLVKELEAKLQLGQAGLRHVNREDSKASDSQQRSSTAEEPDTDEEADAYYEDINQYQNVPSKRN